MARMTGPDCAVMCNLINIHKYIHTYIHTYCYNCSILVLFKWNAIVVMLWEISGVSELGSQ